MKLSRSFKIISVLADLHIGNRRCSADTLRKQLKNYYFKQMEESPYLDAIFILGDLMHTIVSLNSEYSELFHWFISKIYKLAKKKNLLSPRTFSLLHAVDFADRFTQVIEPALKAGFIVLADRYAYTAFARDVARGADPQWVRQVYNFAIKPDLAVYFDIDPQSSMERICANRAPKFYEAGMDLKLSNDPYESYIIFQGRVIREYQKMVDEFGLVKLDAKDSIHTKQVEIRRLLKEILNAKGVEI